ncbi:MAG: FtsX-like permease family protein [Cytophagales bacterium]|nr:FtsX-like permease family protein [Cytophagales bacterium]
MNLLRPVRKKGQRRIGIRKSIGSVRLQLIQQFFSESFLMVFISLGVALGVVWLSLPFFNEVASKSIEFPWSNIPFWIACCSFCLLTALIAGSYPGSISIVISGSECFERNIQGRWEGLHYFEGHWWLYNSVFPLH